MSKSSAVHNLSTMILKDAVQVLTVELTYMYNVCIESGLFPESWSIGKISPIQKNGKSSTDAKDWRLIMQIPLSGKLLECILHFFFFQKTSSGNP